MGTPVEAQFRDGRFYPAVVTSHIGARDVFNVRFDDGDVRLGLGRDALRPLKRSRKAPTHYHEEESADEARPSPSKKKKAKRAAAVASVEDPVARLREELLAMEEAASRDIYTAAWRGVQRDWRRSVEDARTVRSCLDLAVDLERDGWRDDGKFRVWSGDARAVAARDGGLCPGMTRREWLDKVRGTHDADGGLERLQELDFFASDGEIIVAQRSPGVQASLAHTVDHDAVALLGLLPARQAATHPLHRERFASVGDPVFVADAAAAAARAQAFANCPDADSVVVVRENWSDAQARAIETGVRAVVTIDPARSDDHGVTVKRCPSVLVEVVPVPREDTREKLRGQSKCAAKRAIAKYEVLGPYSGLLSEQDAYIKTRGRSVLGLIEHERFALSIDKPLRGRDAFATLVIDPWPGLGEAPRGSPLIACNDCRADPYHSLARNYEPANCAFVNAYVRGFAHVFVVATHDVRPGDELLIDYKESY